MYKDTRRKAVKCLIVKGIVRSICEGVDRKWVENV